MTCYYKLRQLGYYNSRQLLRQVLQLNTEHTPIMAKYDKRVSNGFLIWSSLKKYLLCGCLRITFVVSKVLGGFFTLPGNYQLTQTYYKSTSRVSQRAEGAFLGPVVAKRATKSKSREVILNRTKDFSESLSLMGQVKNSEDIDQLFSHQKIPGTFCDNTEMLTRHFPLSENNIEIPW